jgi:hypothetical protein
MAGGGLSPIGAEPSIPPRQIETEVAVGLDHHNRMMDAMHVGRYHEPPEIPIQPDRKADVAMVEHRGRVKQHLEDEDARGRGTSCRDNAEFDQHGENDLDRVEAGTGSHIKVEIRMMHPVYPPQCWDSVKHYVLQINRQIQQNHRYDNSAPGR